MPLSKETQKLIEPENGKVNFIVLGDIVHVEPKEEPKTDIQKAIKAKIQKELEEAVANEEDLS